ncbi:hypothetical protein M404DRAFT_999653 [Pisolithus tinctorius Marx 270]|uniref:Uncharacterized protein n=1 Tax=Pisolithus tinctorius Marx 270 TaxID=870435 RepID=A0A0C3NYP3_PISTI|nr:hypothetical protein M404DRAFT_999653 [Pisolithus tinctorius Marx 270]
MTSIAAVPGNELMTSVPHDKPTFIARSSSQFLTTTGTYPTAVTDGHTNNYTYFDQEMLMMTKDTWKLCFRKPC